MTHSDMTNNNNICVSCKRLTIANTEGEFSKSSGTCRLTLEFPKHVGIKPITGTYCVICAMKVFRILERIGDLSK